MIQCLDLSQHFLELYEHMSPAELYRKFICVSCRMIVKSFDELLLLNNDSLTSGNNSIEKFIQIHWFKLNSGWCFGSYVNLKNIFSIMMLDHLLLII